MPDSKHSDQSPLGDIIGQTRQRLASDDTTSLLASLVASTAPAPASPPQPAPHPAPRIEPAAQSLPANYFAQIPSAVIATPKRKPVRGPARSLHISMRLSPPERDRLVRWCDDRNLSLPDGIMALLDLVDDTRAGEG